MKLKQVTFAEALEVMKAGKYAYPSSAIDHPYRVVSHEIQHKRGFEDWDRSGNALQCAMDDWFIEVEPMREKFKAKISPDGSLSKTYLGVENWANTEVNVTLEEI